jgi:hypothetical protein
MRPTYDGLVTNADPAAAAAPGPIPRQSIPASLLLCAIFFVAFVCTCGGVGRFLPFPDVATVREKMDHLARYGDQYDVLFIGSSHVQMQIMPSLFDQIAAEAGVPIKSFNLGIPAMVSPEDSYVLDEALRRPHRRLRWVIIETSSPGAQVWGEDTARFGYWHDNPRLAILFRRLHRELDVHLKKLAREHQATLGNRWAAWSVMVGRLFAHLRAWVIRSIDLSRGSDALTRSLRPADWHDDLRGTLGDKLDGWVTAGTKLQSMSPETLVSFHREVAERLERPAIKDRADELCQAALERNIAAIEKAGAKPILLITPTTAGRNYYPTEERERELTILDYSDIRKYPDLYRPENRMDLGHVNDAGARILTRELAQSFIALVKSQPATP